MIVKLPKGLEGAEIYAKAEWFNPGGSVKDRPALWMIKDEERSGRLTRGKMILDATQLSTLRLNRATLILNTLDEGTLTQGAIQQQGREAILNGDEQLSFERLPKMF
jgi:hypothetical protein